MQQDLPQQYYLVVDEKPTGPLTLDEIILHPALSPETLVWKPGIENWVPAHTLPELAPAFSRQEPNTSQTPPEFNQSPRQEPYEYNRNQEHQSAYTQRPNEAHREYPRYGENPQYREGNQYNHHNHYYQRQERWQNGYRPNLRTNWLPWAIVATVFGFFTSCIGAIFGIIGIVQANKANNMYAQGFDREGDSANSNARIMTIIGLIFAGLGILFLIFFGNFVSAISSLSYY